MKYDKEQFLGQRFTGRHGKRLVSALYVPALA